jgi:hypothetical protein
VAAEVMLIQCLARIMSMLISTQFVLIHGSMSELLTWGPFVCFGSLEQILCQRRALAYHVQRRILGVVEQGAAFFGKGRKSRSTTGWFQVQESAQRHFPFV